MSQKSTRKRAEARREKRRKAQTRLIIIVSVVAVAAVAALILISSRPRSGVAADSDYSDFVQEPDRTGGGVGFALGEPDAPVTLVVYSDFSCPHCHDVAKIIDQLIDEYVPAGDLRVVFKPISFVNPPYSRPAASAAICAGNNGKFWEMHDQIWAIWDGVGGPGGYTQRALAQRAEALGLDGGEFRSCLVSGTTAADVQSVIDEAVSRGIEGTPALFVNGQRVGYRGADSGYNDLKNAIEAALGS